MDIAFRTRMPEKVFSAEDVLQKGHGARTARAAAALSRATRLAGGTLARVAVIAATMAGGTPAGT